jgi:AcrR family transcriptional regulator
VETPLATLETASEPRTAKGAATRVKLLSAAETVFGDMGFDAARVADIVSNAGVSHGLFYKHFPHKAAILTAVLARQRGFRRWHNSKPATPYFLGNMPNTVAFSGYPAKLRRAAMIVAFAMNGSPFVDDLRNGHCVGWRS